MRQKKIEQKITSCVIRENILSQNTWLFVSLDVDVVAAAVHVEVCVFLKGRSGQAVQSSSSQSKKGHSGGGCSERWG